MSLETKSLIMLAIVYLVFTIPLLIMLIDCSLDSWDRIAKKYKDWKFERWYRKYEKDETTSDKG